MLLKYGLWVTLRELSLVGYCHLSTSNSSRRSVSWNRLLFYHFLTLSFLTHKGFFVNVDLFFVNFYVCHFPSRKAADQEQLPSASVGWLAQSQPRSFFNRDWNLSHFRFQHACDRYFPVWRVVCSQLRRSVGTIRGWSCSFTSVGQSCWHVGVARLPSSRLSDPWCLTYWWLICHSACRQKPNKAASRGCCYCIQGCWMYPEGAT